MTIYVNFADATKAAIVAVFAGPQDATAYPNQGTVEASDALWATYYATLPASQQALLTPPTTPAAPSLAQQAEALIAGGITITSTGTPALSGTYSTNAVAQANAASVAGYVNLNGKFPGASPSATMTWLDSSGNSHTFPSTTEFLAFYTAAADFVADCQLIMLTNSGTLPAATATIP